MSAATRVPFGLLARAGTRVQGVVGRGRGRPWP
jgi:hypothetical protein